MKTRDFLRLPIGGEFLLTDGIYKQRLYVCQAEDGEVFYRIVEVGGSQYNSVALFPDKEDVYEDGYLSGKRFCTRLRGLSGAAGLSVYGDVSIYNVKFIGRYTQDWKDLLNTFNMHDRISNRRDGFYLRKQSVKKKAE